MHTRLIPAALTVALALPGARGAHAAFGPPTRVGTLPAYPGPDPATFASSCRTAAGTLVAIGQYGAARSVDDGRSWSAIAGLAGEWDTILRAGPTSVHAVWQTSSSAYAARRSTDDGISWTPIAIPATSGDFDEALAPDDGRIAFAWSDAGGLHVITSADDGLNWSPEQALGPAVDVSVAWDGAGDLLVCHDVWGSPWTQREVVCHTSRDRGASFDPPVVVLSEPPISNFVGKPLLTARGQGDFLMLARSGVAPDLWVVSSLDAGSSWSPVTLLPGTSCEYLETRAGWTWASGYGPLQTGNGQFILATSDGSTWQRREPPRDSFACTDGVRGAIHPGAPGEAVLVAGRASWRTLDGGATFDIGTASTGPNRPPAQDLRAVRLPTGRWVALWSDGQGGLAPLRASASDDEGASFAAPTVASDRPRNAIVERTIWGPGLSYEVHRNFDVAVTSAGELVVVWLAADENGCFTVRVSRSPDGITWAPSAPLGDSYQWELSLFSIADDGAGRLACVWIDPTGTAVVSRSTDGGSAWSPPQVILVPQVGLISPTAMVRTPAGSLLLLATGGGQNPQDVVVERSTDGGASWSSWLAATVPLPALDGVLVAAGPRLVAGIHGDCSTGGGLCVASTLLESSDDGLSWTLAPGGPIDAEDLRAGDALGNVYSIWLDQSLHVLSPAGVDIDLGATPFSNVLHDLVVPSPGDLRLLWGDWSTSAPPGIFFAAAATVPLRRDDSIGALTPRPDIAALFPLAPYAAVATSGTLDPDAAVVSDASRPLVLYALGGTPANTLLLSKRAGRLRLDW